MAPADSKPLKIILSPMEESARNHAIYFPKLLELALTKTRDSDGPFEISYHSQRYTTARILVELKYGRTINVIWTSPNEDRERELLPIRISLLQGLNSHRVFLIREEDREKFTAIKTLSELRAVKAGAVVNWPDTKIMQNNDLPVVTTAHYELLFTMLASKRFDYFPRGLNEIWDEQKVHAQRGLVVEESLMFYYPSPIYFFVNTKDKALAERIERGLRIAQEDGSFNELFFSIPGFRKGSDELTAKKRRVFDLATQSSTVSSPR